MFAINIIIIYSAVGEENSDTKMLRCNCDKTYKVKVNSAIQDDNGELRQLEGFLEKVVSWELKDRELLTR